MSQEPSSTLGALKDRLDRIRSQAEKIRSLGDVKDQKAIQENSQFEEGLQRQELDRGRLLNQELQDIVQLKRRMSIWIFCLVVVWYVVVMCTVWMSATGCFLPGSGETFNLSDAVIIALITTTTANVGIFLLVVVKHLFPSK